MMTGKAYRDWRLFKEHIQCWMVLISLFCSASSSYPQENLPAETDSLLQKSIVATVKQNYKIALNLIDQVIASAPEHPIGYLFRAATLQSMMMDYEVYEYEKEFFKDLKESRKLAENRLRQNSNDAWAHFFLGSAYGYESFYVSKKNRYLSAFHAGLKSINHLENAIAINPELYDAYLAMGTYKYYRSKLNDKIKIPFLKDERELGIEMVRKACKRGKYASLAAVNGLTWILLDEERPQEAYALADSILKIYPASRFFLWGAAESATRLEMYTEAREYYQQIFTSLEQEGKLSTYLEAMCRVKMVSTDIESGEMSRGCDEISLIAQMEISKHHRKGNLQKEIKRWQERCEELSRASNGH